MKPNFDSDKSIILIKEEWTMLNCYLVQLHDAENNVRYGCVEFARTTKEVKKKLAQKTKDQVLYVTLLK